jgi:hypothetical protein
MKSRIRKGQAVLFDEIELERKAEYRRYRAQLPAAAAGREARAGIDRHEDEHGSQGRDRDVGDGARGQLFQQEHEQGEDHEEMEHVRERCGQRAQALAQLLIAQGCRQEQAGREQQRAEAQ